MRVLLVELSATRSQKKRRPLRRGEMQNGSMRIFGVADPDAVLTPGYFDTRLVGTSRTLPPVRSVGRQRHLGHAVLLTLQDGTTLAVGGQHRRTEPRSPESEERAADPTGEVRVSRLDPRIDQTTETRSVKTQCNRLEPNQPLLRRAVLCTADVMPTWRRRCRRPNSAGSEGNPGPGSDRQSAVDQSAPPPSAMLLSEHRQSAKWHLGTTAVRGRRCIPAVRWLSIPKQRAFRDVLNDLLQVVW